MFCYGWFFIFLLIVCGCFILVFVIFWGLLGEGVVDWFCIILGLIFFFWILGVWMKLKCGIFLNFVGWIKFLICFVFGFIFIVGWFIEIGVFFLKLLSGEFFDDMDGIILLDGYKLEEGGVGGFLLWWYCWFGLEDFGNKFFWEVKNFLEWVFVIILLNWVLLGFLEGMFESFLEGLLNCELNVFLILFMDIDGFGGWFCVCDNEFCWWGMCW